VSIPWGTSLLLLLLLLQTCHQLRLKKNAGASPIEDWKYNSASAAATAATAATLLIKLEQLLNVVVLAAAVSS
jgi:hypothetical protein